MSLKRFINGKIFTADSKNSFCESVLVHGNKIVSAGTNEQTSAITSDKPEIIDLKNKLMLPGFIDAHLHFMWGASSLNSIDLSDCSSTQQFRDRIKSFLNQPDTKSWLTGGKWDNSKWDINKLPAVDLVDDITGDIPLFLERIDLHMALVNSAALRIAGITENTPQPPGGIIEKDSAGKLTGIIKDSAITLVKNIIPKLSQDELHAAAIKGFKYLNQFGITSFHDITNPEDIQIYKKLEKEGKLTCRINSIYPLSSYTYITGQKNTDKLRFGALKAFSDGSLGSGTAWFFDDYSDEPGNKGIATDVVLNGTLDLFSKKADNLWHQLCIHAIGDKANSYVLDLFDRLRKENGTRGLRHRLEHAQHLNPDLIKRFRDTDIITSVQPAHLFDDGCWAEKRIGPQRKRYTYPFRSLIDNGAMLSFGSDWTVASPNPLLGIYSAVTRQTSDGENPDGWVPEEKISVKDAVRAYTINNAYASFEEKIKGSIEPGKHADMVILSDDIFTISPEKIKDVKVEQVIFNGEKII